MKKSDYLTDTQIYNLSHFIEDKTILDLQEYGSPERAFITNMNIKGSLFKFVTDEDRPAELPTNISALCELLRNKYGLECSDNAFDRRFNPNRQCNKDIVVPKLSEADTDIFQYFAESDSDWMGGFNEGIYIIVSTILSPEFLSKGRYEKIAQTSTERCKDPSVDMGAYGKMAWTPENREKTIAATTAGINNPATIDKMRKKKRGRLLTKTARQKMSQVRKGKKFSAATVEKIAANNRLRALVEKGLIGIAASASVYTLTPDAAPDAFIRYTVTSARKSSGANTVAIFGWNAAKPFSVVPMTDVPSAVMSAVNAYDDGRAANAGTFCCFHVLAGR